MTEYLYAYSVRVRELYEKDYSVLSDFDGSGTDLLPWFEQHLQGISADDEWWLYEPGKTMLSVDQVERVDDRTVHALVRAGQWGDRFTIADHESPDEELFDKLTEHAVIVPLYIRMHVPEGQTMGLLLTQKSGRYGIKTAFWDANVAEAFRGRFDEHRIYWSTVNPREVVEAYEERGSLHGITLIRNKVPTKVSEGLELAQSEDGGRVKVEVLPPRGHRLEIVQSLKQMLLGEADMDELLELVLSDEEDVDRLKMDEIQVELEVGGRRRKVAIRNEPAAFNFASYVIEPELDEEDWPLFESVAEKAEALQNELLSTTLD